MVLNDPFFLVLAVRGGGGGNTCCSVTAKKSPDNSTGLAPCCQSNIVSYLKNLLQFYFYLNNILFHRRIIFSKVLGKYSC